MGTFDEARNADRGSRKFEGYRFTSPFRVLFRIAFQFPTSAFRVPRSALQSSSQRGFTLASLLVILSIIAVLTAFFVPKMWSDIMWRERDAQTIFVMKQYARAVAEYQRARGAFPTSLEQLEDQTLPRVLRQSYVNPLSGELDWVLVPQGAVTPGQGAQGQPGQGGRPTAGNLPPTSGQGPDGQTPGTNPTNPQNPLGQPGGGDPRDYRGPFIGVRPPQSGDSFLELNGEQNYESWMYTVNELLAEQQAAGAGPPQQPGQPPKQN
jgi:type II secretory pathway pseudopilin PulG